MKGINDNTVHLIGRLKRLMDEYIIYELESYGIEGIVPSHGDIIVSLIYEEFISMSELATKINKDPSTVTTLVKKLNKLGYIKITKDLNDKRSNLVSLTQKGKNLENTFIEISEKLYKLQYQNISEEEIKIFRRILLKLIQNYKMEEQN